MAKRRFAAYVDTVNERPQYLTGQFLLAMPGIGDPRFERSVIAMCAHDRDGALGIGVGATVEGIGFHDLLDQFGIDHGVADNRPVHFGGPVEPQRGFILHSTDWTGQDTVDVAGRWALSGTIDALRAIAQGTGPDRWVVALGHAGWGEGQLDAELTQHGWFTTEGSTALLFDHVAADRWNAGFEGAGIDPRMLVAGAGHA